MFIKFSLLAVTFTIILIPLIINAGLSLWREKHEEDYQFPTKGERQETNIVEKGSDPSDWGINRGQSEPTPHDAHPFANTVCTPEFIPKSDSIPEIGFAPLTGGFNKHRDNGDSHTYKLPEKKPVDNGKKGGK